MLQHAGMQEGEVAQVDERIPDDQMVKIGVVAKRLGVSIRTIHMYEREGLFIAYKNAAGTRYFHERDVEWLFEIRKLIKSGISIAGIRRLMSLIPCWESKQCNFNSKHNCPVIEDNQLPCWANKDNQCKQTSQECRDCEVYEMRFCISKLKNFIDIRFKEPPERTLRNSVSH
uniref:Putative MerR family Transcriptional regulator n=1 Tax=Magnetococcus massalia (strain MO-1) TaxID=451514 RepID=A0A1S7LDU3_MAGMO|nr:putative MerR family Transcriptional regulator [Candidatus Magnetococcus massalia]